MSKELPVKNISNWFVENLPYKIMWMNEQGQIVYANYQFCKLLGYVSKEVNRLSVHDINPTSSPESWSNHWQIVKEKGVYNFKAVHQTKKGKYFDVEVFAYFFSNNGKEFIAAIVNEISESSFYKNLLDHAERMANVGGWKLHLHDGSIVVTEQALRIFGIADTNELLPGNVIHHFDDSEELKELLRGLIRNGESFDKVLQLKEKKDGVKYIRCVAEPILHKSKIIKIIGTYQDVSESIERQRILSLYKEIIDDAVDLVYVYNREGDLLHYSQSVPKTLGFTKQELDHFSIYDLDANITPAWWDSHMDEIAKNKTMRFEWLVTKKDGSKFQAEIVANHIIFNGEDLNCAIIRDITNRKQRENDLYRALEENESLKKQLLQENEYLQTEIKRSFNFDNIICQSKEYEQILEKVNQVAPTDTTVLITGESGTGKELLARAVHDNSQRKDRPLIKVNAATLPSELIESELFGHRKGAFTGATEHKLGKFSLADGGTIFLDEIGELPFDLQSKLLRVIQEGEFDMLGGTKTIKVDVRIVAATNRDLLSMVNSGKFREDLYYRLNVFPIHNIPLRERKGDIPLLAEFFLEKYASKAGKGFRRLSKKTVDALMKYNFPGNIRELENLIERAVIIEEGTTLNPGSWLPSTNVADTLKEEFKSFEAMQREYIIKVLNKTNWRVSGPKGAATILDVKDKTLFAKMKRLGIERAVGQKNTD